MKFSLLFFSVFLAFHFTHAEQFSIGKISQNDENTTTQSTQIDGEFGSEVKIVTTQLSKSELWINAKKWISSSFNNYKHTVDMEDKESGTIILKINSSDNVSAYLTYKINATLKIDIRENKYRYSFSNVTFSIEPSDFVINANYNYWPTNLLEDAKAYMDAAEHILSHINLIGPAFKNEVDNYEEVLENTKKYKNEKDEKKNKVTKEYKKVEPFYKIVSSIEAGYNLMRYGISESLENAMSYKDDF